MLSAREQKGAPMGTRGYGGEGRMSQTAQCTLEAECGASTPWQETR